MSAFFCNFAFFCLGFLMLLGLLFSMMSFIKFAQNIIDDIEDKKRFSSDSKDFKINDPVVVSCIGDRIIYTYIDGYDARLDKFSLESLQIEWVSPERLRYPTKEELEKYFRK